jgi:bacteriocin-like protein
VTGSYSKPNDNQTTTVKVGEHNLPDVAKRLNVDSQTLQQANPNLSASDNLKVGQEICLPQGPKTEGHRQGDDDTADSPPSSDRPRTPLGDPMAKNIMQQKLEQTGKDEGTKELSEKDLAQVSGGVSPSVSSSYGKIKVSYNPEEGAALASGIKRNDKISPLQNEAIKKASVADKGFDVLRLKPW